MSRKQELVTKQECKETREDCTGVASVEKINLALWGKDGRGGIVKDIADIKSQLKVYSGVVRQLAVPILVAVIVAVLAKLIP